MVKMDSRERYRVEREREREGGGERGRIIALSKTNNHVLFTAYHKLSPGERGGWGGGVIVSGTRRDLAIMSSF